MKFSMKEEKQKNAFKQIKKSFTAIVDHLETEVRKTNINYRDKYLQILDEFQKLHELVNECYNQFLEDKASIPFCEDTPIELVHYFKGLVSVIRDQYRCCKKEQLNIKQETNDILNQALEERVFESLAKKNLENYDLREEVKKLKLQLKLSQEKNKTSQDIIQNLRKTYHENEQENFKLLLTISDLLKKAETNEIELKQSNRLLKELLQTHKIQFERYKTNFKVRDNFKDKENKMRRIIEKKFAEREKIIVQQLKTESSFNRWKFQV